MKPCTCAGYCRGKEGLGDGYQCVLEQEPQKGWGEPIPDGHDDKDWPDSPGLWWCHGWVCPEVFRWSVSHQQIVMMFKNEYVKTKNEYVAQCPGLVMTFRKVVEENPFTPFDNEPEL